MKVVGRWVTVKQRSARHLLVGSGHGDRIIVLRADDPHAVNDPVVRGVTSSDTGKDRAYLRSPIASLHGVLLCGMTQRQKLVLFLR